MGAIRQANVIPVPKAPPPREGHPLAILVNDQIRNFEVLAAHADAKSRREYRALISVMKHGLPTAILRGVEV